MSLVKLELIDQCAHFVCLFACTPINDTKKKEAKAVTYGNYQISQLNSKPYMYFIIYTFRHIVCCFFSFQTILIKHLLGYLCIQFKGNLRHIHLPHLNITKTTQKIFI